jgi:hypothetical protein
MPTPHFTLPDLVFLGLVLACFAAFAVTLAGVHLYVTLPPRRRPRETPELRVSAYAMSQASDGSMTGVARRG